MTFICNICGALVQGYSFEDLDREVGVCSECGSNVRIRALAHLAGIELFDNVNAIVHWPERFDILAYGISDWPEFSRHLRQKISYVNTQFDATFSGKPMLDILEPRPNWVGTADLVICSEVLEHVVPPVQRAFDGLAALLNEGGLLVFSVPHSFNESVEYFPELHSWKIENHPDGTRSLINTTKDGRRQLFNDLVFHGGGAAVLEMRVLGLEAIYRHLFEAGFCDIKLMNYDVIESGIHFKDPWSRPMTARKSAKQGRP